MGHPVIVDALRSPVGRAGGALAGLHPADLLAQVLIELVARNGLDPALVGEVVTGCQTQVGAQALGVGRMAVLAAGWPEAVAATAVDRRGLSSHAALALAAATVVGGDHDVVIAAGVESVSMVAPDAGTRSREFGAADAPTRVRRAPRPAGPPDPDGLAMLAGITRAQSDAWVLTSHHRAARARAAGRLDHEVVAVAAPGPEGPTVVVVDEGVRPTLTAADLAAEAPRRAGGVATSVSVSAPADGAAAVLVASEAAAARLGLTPVARLAGSAVVGAPDGTDTGVVAVTSRLLERGGLTAPDLALAEVDESSAPALLAALQALDLDPARVNPHGGALAFGDPLGAAGVRAVATLIGALSHAGPGPALLVAAADGLGAALLLER